MATTLTNLTTFLITTIRILHLQISQCIKIVNIIYEKEKIRK
jgi:hypothetical protein